MKYLLITSSFFLLIVLNDSLLHAQTSTEIKKVGRIKIKGTAIDMKAGAAVIEFGKIYYVDNLVNWPKEVINHQVSLKGKLIIYITHLDPNDVSIPQFVPNMQVVQKAKYKVLDK